MYGGIFKLKEQINKQHNKLYNRILKQIYYNYFNNKCSYIDHLATFDNIPLFPHGIYGIFISGSAKIGKNCVIFQNVTIGSNTIIDSKNQGAPDIGNNCYIGAGAMIIGNVKIGDNCRIGANTTVTHDVPADCLIVSQSPIMIKKDGMDNHHYSKNNKGEWVYFDDGQWKIYNKYK